MPHEVIRRVFAWMAALGLGVSWVAAVAVQSPGPFKSGTELVLLPVSARDAAGRVVRDLVAADFRIFENGRPQQISHFSGRHLPVALSLLLDTSSSMQGPLEAAQVAAIALLDQMGPEDVAQLVAFNTTVDIRQDFSRDRQLLRRAISGTQAGGATALHNAVYIALRGLQKLRPTTSELRREAIVVLSAGQDTASAVTADQVVDAALRSQTLIYTLGSDLMKCHGCRRAERASSLYGGSQSIREVLLSRSMTFASLMLATRKSTTPSPPRTCSGTSHRNRRRRYGATCPSR